MPEDSTSVRRLIVVRHDELQRDSHVFDDFDPDVDAVFMAEVRTDFNRVRSHKARIALFLSGMRHFREMLMEEGIDVIYRELKDVDDQKKYVDVLETAVDNLSPNEVVMARPDRYEMVEQMRNMSGVNVEMQPSGHFLCPLDWFEEYKSGRKTLRQEYFYREMRRMHDVLMDGDDPVGGEWNYDKDNRDSFSADGPSELPEPVAFTPDEITSTVMELVGEEFSDHPGSLEHFDWPVTPLQARDALDDFVERRLTDFGDYQDAMWTEEPYLYHSRLSAALNLKLLHPMDAIRRAEEAYEAGDAPLNAVEGFIRQILGWREYVRGVYWSEMPGYIAGNALGAERELPWFYWTGETDMECLHQCITQTLEYGYAHHIQRLMVTGLYALLLGVEPQQVHEWYLAVYVDAHEWVELPNTLGMSQYGDGGIMASKPYAASGKYIDRMSNYCDNCPYDPGTKVGDEACPFTTLYWDFLTRNRDRLSESPRMGLQLGNLDRLGEDVLDAIEVRKGEIIE